MVRVTRHVAARLAREGAPDAGRRVLSLRPDARGRSRTTWTRRERPGASCRGSRARARRSGPRPRPRPARPPAPSAASWPTCRTCPPPPLHETILAFHDTPGRLVAFERAVAADRVSRASGCRREVDALLDRRALASALAEPAARGEIPVRPTHNDAKIANVLFDETTGEGLCVVDLDTVMPGPRPVRLRRPRPLDGQRLGRGRAGPLARPVRVPVFEALARGFVEGAGDALSPAERSLLVTGAEVIVYEQAIRFLGDHLDGDRYYRTTRPGHNLDRARTQIRCWSRSRRRGPSCAGSPAGLTRPDEGRPRSRRSRTCGCSTRHRGDLFFVAGWPVVLAVLFGVIFAAPPEGRSPLGIALVDEDGTDGSRAFAARLARTGGLDVATRRPAGGRGARAAGPAGRVGGPARPASARPPRTRSAASAPAVEMGIDPTRKAEAAMLEGLLAREAAAGLQERLSDREASRRMVADALSRLRYAPPWSPERKRNERFLGELDRWLADAPADGGRLDAPASRRRAAGGGRPTGAAPGARSSSRSRRGCCGGSSPARRTSRSGSSGSARPGRWGAS